MVFDKRLQQFLQVLVGIYMQRLRAIHHAQRRYQSNQPKTMVAMQMRDKDRIEPSSFKSHLAHSELYSFTAINQKRLVVEGEHLTGRTILIRR